MNPTNASKVLIGPNTTFEIKLGIKCIAKSTEVIKFAQAIYRVPLSWERTKNPLCH